MSSVYVSKDAATFLDVPAFAGSSQAMENHAHKACLQQFIAAYPGVSVKASVKDGDVAAIEATRAAFATAGYRAFVKVLRCVCVACVCVCVCVYAHMRECVCVRPHACVRVCVRARVPACV